MIVIPLPKGVDRIAARPRSESLYDTEMYAPTYTVDGNVVELVLGLGPIVMGPRPFRHYLVRRKHDRQRLVVEASALKEIPMAPVTVFKTFSGSAARPFRGFAPGFDPCVRPRVEKERS